MTSLPLLDMHCHPIQARSYVTRYPLTDNGSLLSVAADQPSLLAVTMSPDEWSGRASSSVAGSAKSVWALGLHPWEQQNRDQLASFLNLVPECDAVGEVGLDGSLWAGSDLNSQREILITILDNQHSRDRIVSIHGYEANADLIGVLEEHLCAGVIYHWFFGNSETLQRAIALDIFYSVNHAMFSVPEGSELVSAMPRTRVLMETDAPSIDRATGRALSPGAEETDDRPLWPGEVGLTEVELGQVWGVDVAEVRRQVWQNLAELESRLQRRPFSAVEMLSRLDASGSTNILER
jgi:TatD DNase family protein